MIMVLSDGGKITAETEKQLKLHNDKYVFLFSDVIVASRFGKGNVIIGKPSKREMVKAYLENKIDRVIDATEKPVSNLSQAALVACDHNIKYVKLVSCEKKLGVDTILSYKDLAEKIKSSKKNTLIYSSEAVTRAISGFAGDSEEKIFVIVKRSPIFNVKKAMEYSIPLLNIKEYDGFSEVDEMKEAIKTLSVGQIIFTEKRMSDEMIDAAKQMGVRVMLTHSSGIEYPNCVDNVRDALILIHNKKDRI